MAIEREKTMVEIDDLLRGIFGSYLKMQHQASDLDMTLGQMECLRAINQLGAPSMSELSRHLHLQPSTLTGLVDGLVQRGRVVRREDPSDRRVVRVELTEHGRVVGRHHHEQVKKRLLELLGELEGPDLEALHRGLGLLYEAAQRRMREQEEAGTSPSSGEQSA
ncbi:MarR family transcriptional regulator [bacterium]|nr:MarR family transcriptional regulator [bacterium]